MSANLASQTQDLKEKFLAITDTEFAELKSVYHYRWLRKYLIPTGWLNILLGGLTLLMGLSGASQNVKSLIQGILGAIILGQSLWGVVAPSVPAIRRWSFVFFITGVWNLFLGLSESLVGGAFLVGLLGAAQLWWAFQFYKTYQRCAALTLRKPSPEISRRYDELWRILAKGPFSGEEGFIEMQIGREKARGLLLPERAMLAFQKRGMVIVADKVNVSLTPNNLNTKAKKLTGNVKFDIVSSKGVIPRVSYERYTRWKGAYLTALEQ